MNDKIESVSDYLNQVKKIYTGLQNDLQISDLKTLFFRGHRQKSFQLLPSAFRSDVSDGAERTHLLNYRDQLSRHSKPYHFIKERTEILADMQHYGLKTRLMDWSFSPLVALHFALLGSSETEDSVVHVFNPWQYRKELFPEFSDELPHAHSMHVLSRALLPDHSPQSIEHILRAEFYGEDLKPTQLEKPFPFISKFNNQRIIHQSGCFTIHGSEKTPLDCFAEISDNPQIIQQICIPAKSRKEMRKELRMLFINDYSIFPDMEGMTQQLKKSSSLYSISEE